ncbi:MAG: tRNA (5-methylaminomethyl-2-thiouridine)(34)-methyltransferase MnmD [Gammaproteobacteria bacterium]|nr:tRNA (5-methylaminomethyl-2-thiouridine)(34)-methyltransferase MnmD [Gammaproteobacteria bacterium]
MPETSPQPITPAQVDFEGKRPVSRAFGDVYYDTAGPAEVGRVFLAPAQFEARTADPAGTFTVGELGFGTGLNFIVAAHRARSRLHFISVERHPLSVDDLARSLATWTTAFPLARDFVEHYPPLVPGWHRRLFEDGRIQLSVYFGDVRDALADLARQQRRGIDAWFLDGFAPRRNPAMWRRELFDVIARLSAHRASVTTFTAAGEVRRDLARSGFEVRRVDQRPHKRHSTAGVFAGRGRDFVPPPAVAVVGAGLAGTATARALADKGIRVAIADAGEGIAAGASGIPAAVSHPRLSHVPSPFASFRMHAFGFAAHRCRGLPGVRASGVLQLPGRDNDTRKLERIAQVTPAAVAEHLEPGAASDRAGLVIRESALFFPTGLTVDVRRLSEALCHHRGIEFAASRPDHPSPVVRATGWNTDGFDTLEVTGLAGQMDRFRCGHPPQLPIVGGGTFVPAAGSVWAGATYEYRPWATQDATSANAQRFQRLFGSAPGNFLERFRGIRAVTSDRLPVIGFDAGVWLNLGHGSHGTTTAVLGAEIVACAIAGEVGPVPTDLLELVRPGRFRERQTRRPNPFKTPVRGGAS